MSFTLEQWITIKKHCNDAGVEFMSSPFSNAAVDLLEKTGIDRYKVGSGDVSNLFLLEKIAATGKPVLLSSGMSSFMELRRTVNFLQQFSIDVAVLQCTTRYPTQAEDIGLNVIAELKAEFDLPTGFSDHSGNIYAPLAAVALGAEIIEVHITFDQRMFGADSRSSLSIDRFYELMRGIRYLDSASSHPINKDNLDKFTELRTMFGKTLAFNRSMKPGERIRFEDLEHKKPSGMGIGADRYREVIGKKVLRNKSQWDFVQEEDFGD